LNASLLTPEFNPARLPPDLIIQALHGKRAAASDRDLLDVRFASRRVNEPKIPGSSDR
jgi:hypothetical protein